MCVGGLQEWVFLTTQSSLCPGFPTDMGPDHSLWDILGTAEYCAGSLASTHMMSTAPDSSGTTKTVLRHCSMSPAGELHYPACQGPSDHAVIYLAFSTCSLPPISSLWREPSRGTSSKRPSLPVLYPSAQIKGDLLSSGGWGGTREEWWL